MEILSNQIEKKIKLIELNWVGINLYFKDLSDLYELYIDGRWIVGYYD